MEFQSLNIHSVIKITHYSMFLIDQKRAYQYFHILVGEIAFSLACVGTIADFESQHWLSPRFPLFSCRGLLTYQQLRRNKENLGAFSCIVTILEILPQVPLLRFVSGGYANRLLGDSDKANYFSDAQRFNRIRAKLRRRIEISCFDEYHRYSGLCRALRQQNYSDAFNRVTYN